MESKEKVIKEIMNEIDENQLLLPHFQRNFDWKPEKQKSLIASFFYNIPIGSILLLETETDMITKTIGHEKPNSSKETTGKCYLMDGQQRLTTLKGVFDDFFKEDADGMFKKLYYHLKNRWFLNLEIFNKDNKIDESNLKIILDLIKCGEISDDRSVSDIKDLIIQQKIEKTKKEKPFHPKVIKDNSEKFTSFLIENKYIALFLLFSTTEKGTDLSAKYKKLLVQPTQDIFENKWFKLIKENESEKNKFKKILKEDYKVDVDLDNKKQIEELSKQWAEEMYESLRHFLTERRKLFILTYKDSFPKAVEAFTAMNRGGLPLSTFDIIVAKYAALNRKKLLKERIQEEFEKISSKTYRLLPEIDTNELFNHFTTEKDTAEKQKFYNLYLNMLSIFSTSGLASDCIKEKNKLSLTKDDIDENTDKAVISISLAFRFLSGYCGISNIGKISYELMLLPIAKSLYDKYEKNENLDQSDVFKILYWYWSSIFGGRYREKQNSRSMEDIKNLNSLLKAKKNEEFKWKIVDKIFSDDGYSDLESLRNKDTTRSLENSILQFILADSVLDDELSNSSDLVNRLVENNFEEAHLISISDYNKKNEDNNKIIKRKKAHYINSVLNLALLPKLNNRFDYTQSWYSWKTESLKEYKILIPEKIGKMTWDTFMKKAKNAKVQEWNKLCESFITCRFKEIERTVKNKLEYFKHNW